VQGRLDRRDHQLPGSKSSFGSSQATCTITKMTHSGNVYTINDKSASTSLAAARSSVARNGHDRQSDALHDGRRELSNFGIKVQF
jgi:hypothetical protein